MSEQNRYMTNTLVKVLKIVYKHTVTYKLNRVEGKQSDTLMLVIQLTKQNERLCHE